MESPRGNDEDALIRRCRCKRTSSCEEALRLCTSASPYGRTRARTHPHVRVALRRHGLVRLSSYEDSPERTRPCAGALSHGPVLLRSHLCTGASSYEDASRVPGNFPDYGPPLASAETRFGATGARRDDGPSTLVSRLGPPISIPRAEAPLRGTKGRGPSDGNGGRRVGFAVPDPP